MLNMPAVLQLRKKETCLGETRELSRRAFVWRGGALQIPPPDFLWTLVALANIMRLSLQKAAHAVVARSRGQEIRVGFARDDKG